jgi:hypothetical protein
VTEVVGRLKAVLSDRYAIERELGQGGMATVCLAHDLRHDRHGELPTSYRGRPDVRLDRGSALAFKPLQISVCSLPAVRG